jgi:hypothetical protein
VSALVGVGKQSIVEDAVAGMYVILQVLEEIEVDRSSEGMRMMMRICIPDRRVWMEA